MGETKVCTKCGVEKPATTEYFYKARLGKYGLFATCKNCKRELFRDSQKKYREEHKEQYRYWQNTWRENNKEHEKEYRENYYKENKETIKERNRECRKGWDSKYDKNNKDRIKEFKRNYRKTERGKLMAIKSFQKRRARKRELESSFTIKQWNRCKEYFNNICCYCGKDKELTQDHFIPLVNGGEYTKNNIVPCCLSCNSSKGNKDFLEWYPVQEFYSKEREKKILKYLNYNKKAKTQQLTLTV
jgi:5-methylcytosine-specific restriction endonuclease McrA